MSDDVKRRADARLEAALAAASLEDSRPLLRDRLRHLRADDPPAFERAVQHYEGAVLPKLAAEPAPLDTWLAYAHLLGDLAGAGRYLAIAADGIAMPYAAPYLPGTLVLHIPDDTGVPAMAAAVPAQLSAAQRATLDLLVLGRLG